jgi:anaphase-promoting complex subunit 6
MSSGSFPANAPNNNAPPPGGDPLVLNELGVVLYHEGNLEGAVDLFRQSLALAISLQCDPGAWLATRANLGHALRRLERLQEALAEFDECLRIGAGGSATPNASSLGRAGAGAMMPSGTSAVGGYEDRGLTGSLHTARGIVLLEMGRTMEAVTALHEAVRVLGTSGAEAAAGAGVAGTLLSRALEIWALEGQTSRAAKPQAGMEESRKVKGGKTRERQRDVPRERTANAANEPQRHWTDDVVHTESPSFEVQQQTVEMELDDDADGVLTRALSRVRPRQPQALPLPGDAGQLSDPSGPSRGRSSRSMGRRRSPTRRGPGG